MNFFKKLLASKTIQGILAMAGGALMIGAKAMVTSLEATYPTLAPIIDVAATALLSGGFVHAVHGRITAQGPIVADGPVVPKQ